MKKAIIIIVIIIVILGAAYLILTHNLNNSSSNNTNVQNNNDNPLGSDRDEHGCIPSAGYSWCEPKNKCLRLWEENCYENLTEEIQYLLAEKYEKPTSEVQVTITKETDEHAAGSVKFGEGRIGEGGVFLAIKIDNIWQLVFDGNGSIDCTKMREEYNFPDEILKPNFCD